MREKSAQGKNPESPGRQRYMAELVVRYTLDMDTPHHRYYQVIGLHMCQYSCIPMPHYPGCHLNACHPNNAGYPAGPFPTVSLGLRGSERDEERKTKRKRGKRKGREGRRGGERTDW